MVTIVASPGLVAGRVGIVPYLRHFVRWYRTALAIAVTVGAFGLLLLVSSEYASHRQAALRHERLAEASKVFGPASPYARFKFDVTDAPIRVHGVHALRELVAVSVVATLLAILVHRHRIVWAAATMMAAVVGVGIGAGPLADLVQPNALHVVRTPFGPPRLQPGASAYQRALVAQSSFLPSTFETSGICRALVAVAVLGLLIAFVFFVRRLPTPSAPGVAPALLDFVALNYTIGAFVFLMLCWPTTDTAASILGPGSGAIREFGGSLAIYVVIFAAGVVAIRSTRLRSRRSPRASLR